MVNGDIAPLNTLSGNLLGHKNMIKLVFLFNLQINLQQYDCQFIQLPPLTFSLIVQHLFGPHSAPFHQILNT